MIKYFSVENLVGIGSFETTFNSDLNILTGRNGAGKTTVLKLLWYIISGNIQLAIREISFSRVTVETDLYKITIVRRSTSYDQVFVEKDGKRRELEPEHVDEDGDIYGDSPIEQGNNFVVEIGSSIFFPTFRRIEGGFGLAYQRRSNPQTGPGRRRNALEEAMNELSTRLTNNEHTFIASISTVDIVSLLMKKYTEISEKSNILQQTVSEEIIDKIKLFKKGTADSGTTIIDDEYVNAEKMLDKIRSSIEELDETRRRLLAPFDQVRSLVQRLFKHSGITMNQSVSFGDAANAISSEALSAGEKQMLSFICYNVFYHDSVVFIDEPELSLHVDWQRQLFPVLLKQGTSNQFIIATHSPFIYSKYPDKEIILLTDKGDAMSSGDEDA